MRWLIICVGVVGGGLGSVEAVTTAFTTAPAALLQNHQAPRVTAFLLGGSGAGCGAALQGVSTKRLDALTAGAEDAFGDGEGIRGDASAVGTDTWTAGSAAISGVLTAGSAAGRGGGGGGRGCGDAFSSPRHQ